MATPCTPHSRHTGGAWVPPEPFSTLPQSSSKLSIPAHQHPSSPSLDSLHKCSANLLPPTAGPLSVVIQEQVLLLQPSCWALTCSRPAEHEPLSFNSTSVSCTSSSRAGRGGCQSSFFLLLLTESFESRSTSPARSLNDSRVILPLKSPQIVLNASEHLPHT